MQLSTHDSRPHAPSRPSEAGNAYIITMLIMVVLTIVGLSLSLTSQTEMLVGAAEPSIQRVLYAADSGLALATARRFTSGARDGVTFGFSEDRNGTELRDEVELTPLIPILASTCNLCEINQGSNFATLNHYLAARATRKGITGTEESVLARKTVTVNVQIQPLLPQIEDIPQDLSSAFK